jgi:hypothetical protein
MGPESPTFPGLEQAHDGSARDYGAQKARRSRPFPTAKKNPEKANFTLPG